ncbi:hypothetical protein A3H38_03920 [candidate division WOR-1 bacterium RIFCSPLOWO2_02_FULL_46_20]|uniref:Phosphotyrosine protein phosphatase I domain-containing protein n=1 Tax=candidate division WOR-1 bacterium RIFCSPLOWO2_02_FULL_46_20 TaxID=1802567 RepID=A0A1F4RC45_UNCSA|nr:MAG: hypothetical protein A3J44_01640 [candidate division WOR-1 bacterium RIFCSPHIGHO2_02_FULL_45_12]OGC05761.1 MAG: hypothetical protein A3H38_03920 [candidate division WOR-1 bacterium RIFCSPLOWO2_02_FULL_46_20]
MKKRALFVCIANAARSQMAQGFARQLAPDRIEAFSAGSQPAGVVSAKAIEVMKEIGVDISGHHSKGFNDLPIKDFDYVVTMGCGDVCPFYPAKKKIDWPLADPKGMDLAGYRQSRDKIKKYMVDFLRDI